MYNELNKLKDFYLTFFMIKWLLHSLSGSMVLGPSESACSRSGYNLRVATTIISNL